MNRCLSKPDFVFIVNLDSNEPYDKIWTRHMAALITKDITKFNGQVGELI